MDMIKGFSPTLTVGGRVFKDLDNLKILTCSFNAGSRYATGTLANPPGPIQYTPPVGFKFVLKAVSMQVRIVASSPSCVVGSATAYNSASGSAVAHTGFSSIFGDSSAALLSASQLGKIETAINWELAAGLFLAVDGGGTAGAVVQFFGYEVPV